MKENIVEKRILSELRIEKQKQLKLRRRILEEQKKAEEAKKDKKETKKKTKKEGKRKLRVVDSDHHQDEGALAQAKDLIFGQAYHRLVDIENYKTVVKMNGLSPLDAGRNSLISSTMYNQIKTMLNIEKSGLTGGNKVDQPRTLFGSSVNLLKMCLSILLLQLF